MKTTTVAVVPTASDDDHRLDIDVNLGEQEQEATADTTMTLSVNKRDDDIGRAWEDGPIIDHHHASEINHEFRRRELAVNYLRSKMKYLSLPGKEIRRTKKRTCGTRFAKFLRSYFRCCPCIIENLALAVWDADIIAVGELLLGETASPDSRDEAGQLVLSIAIQQRQDHIAKFLLDQGATINIQDLESLAPPLNHALMMGNMSLTRRLIELGADLELADKDLMNPLLWSTIRGYLEMVAFLVIKEVEVNHQNVFGWSALHIACFKDYLEVVSYLLSLDDIEPAIEDIHGFTPRHYAQIEKNVGVLKLLDQYESKLTSENSSSRK